MYLKTWQNKKARYKRKQQQQQQKGRKNTENMFQIESVLRARNMHFLYLYIFSSHTHIHNKNYAVAVAEYRVFASVCSPLRTKHFDMMRRTIQFRPLQKIKNAQ